MNRPGSFPAHSIPSDLPGAGRGMLPSAMEANVLKIQRYAINDGPGIRTTVFLKGCPLRCQWCHNPEAMKASSQLMYNEALCRSCQRCALVCPHEVHLFEDGRHVVDFAGCMACGACVEACPQDALSLQGSVMALNEIMTVIRRDTAYYRESGGGVTISGGEPLAQPGCVEWLISACHDDAIPVFLDTCGQAAPAVFDRVVSHADGVLYDLKIMDRARHRAYTGADNAVILANFRRLCTMGKEIWVRCVVLPGINDDEAHRVALAQFLRECAFAGRIELLPYHRYGMGKYAHLGLSYTLPHLEPPAVQRMVEIRDFYEREGFSVSIR